MLISCLLGLRCFGMLLFMVVIWVLFVYSVTIVFCILALLLFCNSDCLFVVLLLGLCLCYFLG